MKKVVFYCVATHLGGAERSLLDFLKLLHSDANPKFSAHLIFPSKSGPFLDEVQNLGLHYSVLPFPKSFFEVSRQTPIHSILKAIRSGPAMLVYQQRLRALLKEIRPDLIHTTGLKCHILGALTGSALKIPVVWHLRDIFPKGPTRTALKIIQKISKPRVIANSRATAQAFSSRRGAIPVVYNGIDAETYRHERRRDYNSKLGIDDSKPIIGIVGVLAKWKGQIEFLKMAQELVAEGFDGGFSVIGGEIYDTDSDAGYAETLRELTRKLELENKVYFTGNVKNPINAMNSLDVLVHASIRPEAFGRVIVEAYACEVPVVAARSGGVLELVQDGETGLLCDPQNTGELKAQVQRLLHDDELRKNLVQNAKNVFLKNFTNHIYYRKLTEVLT